MSDLYALLIGVDFYFPNQLDGGGSFGHLGGCVRDVTHMAAYLESRLRLPADHILKLTATNTRAIRLAGSSQEKAWSVAQLELRVEAA